jgi:ribosomal protein L16 Arg81 hydroxylase
MMDDPVNKSCSESFENLIQPVTAQSFFNEIWGRRFVHVSGTPARFCALFPWSELNRVLEEHRLRPPRLLLSRNGRPLEMREYMRFDEVLRDFFISPDRLSKHLADGLTLVLNHADELSVALREFIANIEEFFGIPVHANLYAAWGVENGFPLHCDDQDTFILQVYGCKQWTIYGPTIASPVPDGNTAAELSTSPDWDALLHSGSMLYIPRGWWHLVTPVGEPSLHLTLTFQKATGMKLLHWIVDQLHLRPSFRAYLPYADDDRVTDVYLDALRTEIATAINRGSLDAFVREQNRNSRHHVRFQLPDVIASSTEGQQ